MSVYVVCFVKECRLGMLNSNMVDLKCIIECMYIVCRTFDTFDMTNKHVKSNLLCMFLFLSTPLTWGI